MSKTTILIESETRKLLKRVGRKEQTYDELLRELVGEKMKSMIIENEDSSGHGIETPHCHTNLRGQSTLPLIFSF